jgi:hypothetical protein
MHSLVRLPLGTPRQWNPETIEHYWEQLSLFFIRKTGSINIWPGTIKDQLFRAELNRNLVKPYDARLRNILNMGAERKLTSFIAKVMQF